MGKLVRLELYNFKSYKNHHVMHFGDSYFTSIIGPNGSGKSNSMDAISFVLGIKSSHLRSTHLRDLVYRGRVLQRARINEDGDVTEQPNGHANGATNGTTEEDEDAEQGTQTDPTTAWVMAVYEDDNGEEQQWKRIITASGSSEYRINNRRVDAKEYNDTLESHQILIKARNFLVFQGDVEAIAAQSAKDLTRLIEQISGSLDHKRDYDDRKEEYERAMEIHNAKLQQRRGINSELKQYQEQKREAQDYAKKQQERDDAVVTHVLWKLHHFQQTIDQSTEEIVKYQEELKEYRRGIADHEKKLESSKKAQALAKRDVNTIEEQIKAQEKRLKQTDEAVFPVDEKINLSRKHAQSAEARIDTVAKERDSQMRSVDKLQKDFDRVQRAQKKWEDEWKVTQQSTGRDLSASDVQDYNRLRGDVNRRTAAEQIKIDDISRQLKTDEETLKSLQEKFDGNLSRAERLDNDLQELRTRQTDVGDGVRSAGQEIDAKKKTFNKLQSERLRAQQKRTETDEKLQEVLRKLSDARESRQETDKDARTRELVAQLKRLFPGVRGQLWTLCKPKQKKYQIAVSTVLGRHHDAIVVDTEQTAKDCIDYLRVQRAGQATFIPLDTIIHKSADGNIKGMHPGMRLAVDTFDFDSSIERAVSYACGNSIVCDTLQIARHLCYERRVDAKAVTLDGTVISKGGNMTGGQGPDQKNARKYEDNELENLTNLKDKYLSDLEALPRSHARQEEEDRLQGDLSGLESRRAFARDELQHLEQNIDSKQRELDNVQAQNSEIQPKITEHSEGGTHLRRRLQEAIDAVSRVEDEVFRAFCRRLQYADIRAYEAQQGSLQQEAAQKRLEFTTQTSKLQGQLAYEEARLEKTRDRVAALEKQVADAGLGIQALETDKEELDNKLDELRGGLDSLLETLETRKRVLSSKTSAVSDARREVEKRSRSVQTMLKSIEALEADMTGASMSRFNTLKNCLMEKIDVPLQRGSRPLTSLPHDVEEAEPDAMDVDNDDDDAGRAAINVKDYGILVDFDDLEDELKESDDDEVERTLRDSIDRLTSELEKMAPNSRANERLDSTEAKLRDYDAQYKAASRDMNRTRQRFEEVKEQRNDKFVNAFEHISTHIDQVYKDLTKTASFPLGGMASLSLEDDTEPYLSGTRYHAMPPLKRFRDMEHLSGGEKTMAALALLFAIHRYSPSPFFVLDEVDAALDSANTTRLAEYVRQHARPGMQFVVISLKAALFQNSETLVGVMRDQGINSSRALTLDLRKYQAA